MRKFLMHGSRENQWRLPLTTALVAASVGLLLPTIQPGMPVWLQIAIQATCVGAIAYFLFNHASNKMRGLDNTLMAGITELQEQQYAFNQHAIVSMIDCNGALQFVNDRLCDFTGYARSELLGRPFTMLSTEGDLISYNQMLWDKLQQNEVWRGEMRVKKHSGTIGWVDASLVPIRSINGETQHYICIQTDVTARKTHEDALAANQHALQLLAANMEQLIKERTAELEKSNEDLVQANQAKSEFISIVSHELRTPLTSIKSFAEILDDEIDDPDSKRCLRIINEETDRLNRLINDILDLQKIDAGRMVWRDEKVNLVDIARAAKESFSGAYLSKGLGLEFSANEQNLMALVDPDKIRQILANLLSNALKFTQTGKVAIRVDRIWDSRSNQPFLQVAVSDTGLGLTENQLKRVFEQFYQVENNQSRKVQGTGLGLTISKQIIDHYGGRIWAESEVGKGTTFFFIVPDASGASKKLGEILVDLGYITDAEIEQALKQQHQAEMRPTSLPQSPVGSN